MILYALFTLFLPKCGSGSVGGTVSHRVPCRLALPAACTPAMCLSFSTSGELSTSGAPSGLSPPAQLIFPPRHALLPPALLPQPHALICSPGTLRCQTGTAPLSAQNRGSVSCLVISHTNKHRVESCLPRVEFCPPRGRQKSKAVKLSRSPRSTGLWVL